MWQPPRVLPNLKSAKYLSIDCETYDPNLQEKGPGVIRRDGFVVGVSIYTDGFKGYFPFAHQGGGNLDKRQVISWLKDTLSTDCPKLGADILYDMMWLRTEGVEVKGLKFDVQVAEPLLDENQFKYNLEALGQRYFGQGKDETLLLQGCQSLGVRLRKESDVKKYLWQMHSQYVGPYAERDVELPAQLFEVQKRKLEEEDLWEVFMLESQLTDLLLEMKFQGVPVNLKKAEEVADDLKDKETAAQDKLNYLAGSRVDVYARASVAKAFDACGIAYPRTAPTKNYPTGQASFTKDWLEAHPSDLAKSVRAVRRYNKARKDFIESAILEGHVKGRVHPTFHQVKHDEGGTVTGRFSCSDPNLQQVPHRDPELGPLIRSIYVAGDGAMWAKLDYRQQEPRLTVHYAYLRGFPGAAEARQKYIDNPNTDYHQMVADMCQIERRPAKDINLGLAYGLGVNKMAVKLGRSVEETKELFTKYHQGVPFVKMLSEECMRVANMRGYMKTIMGRRRRFNVYFPATYGLDNQGTKKPLPYDEAVKEYGLPLKRAFTYRAMNSIIQGSAADMIKKAMLDMYRAGYIPLVTVHDELGNAAESEKQAREMKQIMCECMKLEVPLDVEVELGPSWGEGKELT